MTDDEWYDATALILDAWPHSKLVQGEVEAVKRRLNTWFDLLADIPGGQVIAAVRKLALTDEFAPTIAKIRAACDGPTRPWESALAELAAAVSAVGIHRPAPRFRDAALQQVAVDRGWPAVCNANPNDSTWRAQFRDAYQTAVRDGADRQRRRLAGLPDGSRNVGYELPASTPVAASGHVARIAAEMSDTRRDPVGRTREQMLTELRARVDRDQTAREQTA